MNSPRIIMNYIYYPDGGHRTRIIIWKFVDNYMAIICFYFNTNCHEFPTNYHEFYLLSRWIELDKNNYMINSWTIT